MVILRDPVLSTVSKHNPLHAKMKSLANLARNAGRAYYALTKSSSDCSSDFDRLVQLVALILKDPFFSAVQLMIETPEDQRTL